MALAIILFGWLASVAPKEFLGHFTVFALSCVVGYYVVWNVSPCAAYAADVGH